HSGRDDQQQRRTAVAAAGRPIDHRPLLPLPLPNRPVPNNAKASPPPNSTIAPTMNTQIGMPPESPSPASAEPSAGPGVPLPGVVRVKVSLPSTGWPSAEVTR